MPPSEPVPLEILELIVDELSTNRSMLKSCLSVSRSFRHCSISHLFKIIEILVEEKSLEASMARVSTLSQLMSSTSCPDLEGVGRYIKTFALSISLDRFGLSHASAGIAGFLQLLGNENMLIVIKGLCGEGFGVQKLYLHITPHRCIKLDELPAEFCAAFQALTRSPYLTTLQVQNMTFLPHTRDNSDVHIKYLQPDSEISESHISTSNQSPRGSDKGFDNQLERLSTDHSFPHENVSWPVLRTLRKLVSYNAGPEDGTKMWEIIQIATSSLRILDICHLDEIVLPSDSFNIGQIPNLEQFSYLQTSSCQNGPSATATLDMLNRLFQVKQPLKSLQVLYFGLEFGATESVRNLFNQKIGDLWKSLDAIFASDKFPLLSSIKINIRIYVPGKVPPTESCMKALAQSLEEKLPFISSSSSRVAFKLTIYAVTKF